MPKAITTAPTGDTFADLHRACHAWLMKRDPTYRKASAAMAAHRPGTAAYAAKQKAMNDAPNQKLKP